MYDGSVPSKGFMRWVAYFESNLVGLWDVNRIDWREIGGRGRVYKFWRSHKKMKYMEALVGEGVGFGEAMEK